MRIDSFYVINDEFHNSLKFKSLELTGSNEERKEKTENKKAREIFAKYSTTFLRLTRAVT